MSRYVRCPDCHRMFRKDRLAGHVNWQLFGHPKAKKMVRRQKIQARKQARRARREEEYESGSPSGLFSRQSPSIRRDLAAHKRAQGVP